MGWNTTVVVMNDALDMIRNDPEFGARLADAVQTLARGKTADVAARSGRGIHCNAATVIETHHADHTVYVKVGQNCGVPFTSEETELFNAASRPNAQTISPTYYVRHPDDTYSVAQPQPQSSELLNLVVAACHEAQDIAAKAQKQAADSLASRDDLVSSIRELKTALEFLLSGVECNCVADNDLSRARVAIAAAADDKARWGRKDQQRGVQARGNDTHAFHSRIRRALAEIENEPETVGLYSAACELRAVLGMCPDHNRPPASAATPD